MNRLAKEKAAYLRHAAHQKIDWYPWSEEAFEKAGREDKPVFLSSGAVWCHWCHVMAKECFEDEEVVKLLNENFVNIKLDRDERPDVDRRYQHAVNAMGSGGGWPLSVFLSSDKKPFFGGTYFPLEDSHGRPGFRKVLRSVSDFYRSRRDEVSEYAQRLVDFITPGAGGREDTGDIKESFVVEGAAAILSEYDPQNGGFGAAPKFPMPGAIEFLINRFFLDSRKDEVCCAIKKTLESMAKGGFHDQLGGGFHRYSVDEAWLIPHFEKMAEDNSWLLRNYVDGYCVFGDEYFGDVAKGIIGFVKDVLSAPDGGFYASQDADVTPDDEGGYLTWTGGDFARVLEDREYEIMKLHLFHERGSVHHDSAKKVLFVSMEPDAIAARLGIPKEEVEKAVGIGKAKLLKERAAREKPFIDKTMYTSLNGMFVSSYLKAYRALRDEYLKEFALRTVDKIMKMHFTSGELLHSDGVRGMLDDYIHMIDALTACYEVTGSRDYLDRSKELMDLCLEKFWDEQEGGFFDTYEEVLGLRLKGMDDVPHPSANALGIILLLKLHYVLHVEEYHRFVTSSLSGFIRRAKDMGIHSGYYHCALDSYFHMMTLTLETQRGGILSDAALFTFSPYTNIVYGEDKGYILPCIRKSCFEPVSTPDALRDFIISRGS